MHVPDHHGNGELQSNEELRLNALFRAFRETCPVPEASANFMPRLWERIESRQTVPFLIRRLASGFVTAAVAVSLGIAVYVSLPGTSPYYNESYIEALADGHATDEIDLVEPVQLNSLDSFQDQM
jgi:hypothetical protein